MDLITWIDPVDKTTPAIHDQHSDVQSAHNLVKTFSDVFKGLGKIKMQAKIYVDSEVKPCIETPCRISHTIESRVKDKLDHMLKLNVIVDVTEPTPWMNSITIVNFACVCLDHTKLNQVIKRGPYPTRMDGQRGNIKIRQCQIFSVFRCK